MSTTFLRIVDARSAVDADATTEWRQLSLFDPRPRSEPRQTLLCLPMMDLHGTTFRRLMHEHRPLAAVDVRSYPYFSMHALDRQGAFDIFSATPTVYVHKPLDLRPPKDPMLFWRVREAALTMMREVVGLGAGTPRTFVVLINKRPEMAVLEQAIRDVGPLASSVDVLLPD